MTSLDFRLRAVSLRSVKSKLGRTGESKLQSSLSSAGLEKSASSPPLGQFALSSPAELRLDWLKRDCSQSTLTSSYERSYSTYAIQPKNPLKQWTNTTQERGPATGGEGGGPFARLNFKTPHVRVYKCVSLIVGFAITVAIWFYALSLLFGSCRLSDFTLARPQESLFYSFPWKSWNWLMHYCPTVKTVNLIIAWKRPCFLNKLKLISFRSSSIKQ